MSPDASRKTIDTNFDFRSDAQHGSDPDRTSPTLRRYHAALWSRPLPRGDIFLLDTRTPGRYLSHTSRVGDFAMSSDTCVPGYLGWTRMETAVREVPDYKLRSFERMRYTIGSMMIWPSTTVKGVGTINAMRGFNSRIGDRLDLTLECVRRHYEGQSSPLARVMDANAAYFGLFANFGGFIEFFELQDLADPATGDVRFMLPFGAFDRPGHPIGVLEYKAYLKEARRFLKARNSRIAALGVAAP
ncbi:hypothetical protein HH308_11585 [Gordonia sp. TBRC 11910]|uniref:Uncharacterized protein n=1 Tax=Gordonia asplenii TaxID=2725283 RepID=A0A848KZM5_9ACTN|nr:hypothetical protein [Gordonia asplenii]NMO01853.1 hypothetical protein [Gordonia asplenii]